MMSRVRKIESVAKLPEYPQRLREIPGAPGCLYVVGELPREDVPCVAVVGARECSEYGRGVAAWLGRELGNAGVQVVSGMARGIDGICQTAVLQAGGISFAVLGCGVDVCYPRQNQELYESLCARGGVLSEYEPGTPPRAQNFPPRNRIVSGLADAVVVVEAREKSGTLITVDMALEQGREVYVVPGRITDGLSTGCNRLMKAGAGILLDVEEFMDEVWGKCGARRIPGWESKEEKCEERQEKREAAAFGIPSGGKENQSGSQSVVSPEEKLVLAAIDFYPRSVEEIRRRLGEKMEERQLNAVLMRLCLAGMVSQVSPGYFCKRESTVISKYSADSQRRVSKKTRFSK